MALSERSPAAALARCKPLTHWPLRRFSRAAAAAHARLLAQPAGPVRWRANDQARQRALWWVELAVNDAPVRLQVQARSLDQWATAVAGPQVPPALASAGVAGAGVPLWQALSSALNAPVQFLHARSMRSLSVPGDAIAWDLPALGWHGVLHAESDGAWQRVISSLPDRLSAGGGDGLMDLPLQVTLGAGRARLNRADFARLKRHCVVVLDEAGAVHRQRDLLRLGVTVLAGAQRRPVARAVWTGHALYRAADFHVVNSGETPSPNPGADVNHTEPDAVPTQTSEPAPTAATPSAPVHTAPDLADVEVEVRFELGRQTWPLRQLVQWRVGQPVALELALADTPVTAWVQERCIASGRLVVVGERLGVRLDEVFAPTSRPPTPRAAAPQPVTMPVDEGHNKS